MTRWRGPVVQLAPVQGVKGITCRATICGDWPLLSGVEMGSGRGGGAEGGSAVRALRWTGSTTAAVLGRARLRCCCWARGARLGAALAQRSGAASSVIPPAAATARVARAR